jgi:hypothetical protein
MNQLKGCVIAESLTDPMIINRLQVYRALISGETQKVDERGGIGRWHLYYVCCERTDIGAIQRLLKPGWYAHFWHDRQVTVVYADARCEIVADEKATWADAIAHGRRHGIPDEQLDFLID